LRAQEAVELHAGNMTQCRVATLHFIYGKPGAGKTTLARELGRTVPGLVFCEDEWISRLGFEIGGFDDFLRASARVRGVIAPLAVDVLRLGVSVVFDFAGNTPTHRAWARALFETAKADHVLHVLELSDDECLANIHRRNDERPVGVYWGHVADEIFRAVTPRIVPPAPDEGFHVVTHARG
jgi:predicted kinase